MAERRMFAKTIIDSDAFIDMPVTARLLYYDLSMRADDDGFVNAPKKIMRMIGASQDDLSILILRKFILPFDNGVVVIKHWRIHNYIRKDTYNETPYSEQKALLELDENKAYRFKNKETYTECIQTVDDPSTQVRLGKVSLGKDKYNGRFKPPTLEEVKLYCSERSNKIDPEYFLDYYETRGWKLSKGQPMKDWKAAVRTWERNNFEKSKVEKTTTFASYPQDKNDLKGFKISKTKVDPEEIRKRLNNH